MPRIPILIATTLILAAASQPPVAQIRPRRSVPIPKASDSKEIPAPADVAAVPPDAQRTASGLAWRRLSAVLEGTPPGVTDVVEVRYTGWQTDGTMFDSTEIHGKARQFRVNGVVAGFEEAVQLLNAGERARFWIPEELAYAGRKGKPQGMLVFDLELIGVTRGPQVPANLAEPPETATRSESGLVWQRLKEGDPTLPTPGEESTVRVEYSSWSTEGRLLDATQLRGEPELFTLNLVIAGFREAFTDMRVGERRMLWIPPELTELDGERVHEGTVVFDVELLSYIDPPVAPAEVSAIPQDATRSLSGLAWRVLEPGSGTVKPSRGDAVEVLYAGWTRDGSLFDSSYGNGGAGRFVLDSRMPYGWNEALFGMLLGEKRLVWIPEELAYGGRKDRPQGMLVFEIELVAIEPAAVDAAAGTP